MYVFYSEIPSFFLLRKLYRIYTTLKLQLIPKKYISPNNLCKVTVI